MSFVNPTPDSELDEETARLRKAGGPRAADAPVTSKTVTVLTAAKITELVTKFPGLGEDTFVHERDYNQAENGRVARADQIERLQGELDAANQHVKILSEARDRLAHETAGDDLGPKIYVLLVRRGYAQHEADAIANSPGCTLNCVQNGYPDIDCPEHGRRAVEPSARCTCFEDEHGPDCNEDGCCGQCKGSQVNGTKEHE